MQHISTPTPANDERKFHTADELREHSPAQLLAAWLRRRMSLDEDRRPSESENGAVAEMELP